MFKDIDTKKLHSDGFADFIFNGSSTIYSIGTDFLLKLYDYSSNQQILREIDIEEEYYCIDKDPNSSSAFIVGGQTNKIELVKDCDFDNTELIMKSSGPYFKIKFDSTGRFIAGASLEDTLQIYDNFTQSMVFCRPSHQSSIINLEFHPQNKYICTTSCDGNLHIYKMIDTENLTPIKIFEHRLCQKTTTDSAQILEISWHPEGNLLALPGSITLGLIKVLEEHKFEFFSEPKITHEKEISIINWKKDNGKYLLTAGLDNKVKYWDFENKTCLWYCTRISPIRKMQFDIEEESNKVVILYFDGEIGVWDNFNFEEIQKEQEKFKELEQIQQIKEEQPPQKIEVVNKEIEKVVEQEIKTEIKDKKEEKTTKMELEEVFGSEKKKQAFKDKILKDAKIKAKKHLKTENFLKSLIVRNPQDVLFPTTTNLDKARRFLCWNYIGSITIRDELINGSVIVKLIDIEFSNTNMKSLLSISINHDFSMGCLGYNGGLIASKALETEEDKYEEEDEELDAEKFSYLQFYSAQKHEDNLVWSHKLPKGENVENITIGNDWCAAATDRNFIRVFGNGGLQIKLLQHQGPIVMITAYENLLVVLYHLSLPLLGCQAIFQVVYDVNKNFKTIYNGPLPLTPDSKLEWFGFSEEGLLLSLDSIGMLRAFVNFKHWEVIWNTKERKKNKKKFWMIGMMDYQVMGVDLNFDEFEPSTHPKPQLSFYKLQFPIMEQNQNLKFLKILTLQLQIQHEKYRYENWMIYKVSRTKRHSLYQLSKSVKDEEQIEEMEEKLLRATLELFREFIIQAKYNKAIDLTRYLTSDYIKIAIQLSEQLSLNELVNSLILRMNIKKAMEEQEEEDEEADVSQMPSRRRFVSLTQQSAMTNESSGGFGLSRKRNLANLAMRPQNLRPVSMSDIIEKEKSERKSVIAKYSGQNKESGLEASEEEIENLKQQESQLMEMSIDKNPIGMDQEQGMENKKRNPFAVKQGANSTFRTLKRNKSLLGELSKDFKIGQKRTQLSGNKMQRRNLKKIHY